MPMLWVLSDERYLTQRMPAALIEWLGDNGVNHRVVLPEPVLHVGGGAPFPGPRVEEDDLVVTRSRDPLTLAMLAAVPGLARATPSRDAVARVRDKVEVARTLARCGIPAPPSYVGTSAGALAGLPPECFPMVVKPQFGDNARGVVIVDEPGALGEVDSTDPLVLGQPFLDSGGVDTKVYVAGGHVWAVRRPSPLLVGAAASVERAAVSDELRSLALRCRDAFDLELLGLDVLETAAGPHVVDVNEFPNYTGVDEAPAAIGEVLLTRLREVRV